MANSPCPVKLETDGWRENARSRNQPNHTGVSAPIKLNARERPQSFQFEDLAARTVFATDISSPFSLFIGYTSGRTELKVGGIVQSVINTFDCYSGINYFKKL